MSLSATILTKPGCAPCLWVKKSLEQHGISYVERDVTTDANAEQTLRALYESRRPGQHPSTPVTLLVSDVGVETIFGPDIRSSLKRYARAATAA